MMPSDMISGEHEDILGAAAAWRDQGREVALATVVTTWGSSPRPVGSQLAVDGAGTMIGSVSGGCIEGAVIHDAKEVMADGKPRLLQNRTGFAGMIRSVQFYNDQVIPKPNLPILSLI